MLSIPLLILLCICTHMSSVNISITEEAYDMLKRRKKEDESFSDIIKQLAGQKDIMKCFGLLADDKEGLEFIEKEALKARKQKWRSVEL